MDKFEVEFQLATEALTNDAALGVLLDQFIERDEVPSNAYWRAICEARVANGVFSYSCQNKVFEALYARYTEMDKKYLNGLEYTFQDIFWSMQQLSLAIDIIEKFGKISSWTHSILTLQMPDHAKLSGKRALIGIRGNDKFGVRSVELECGRLAIGIDPMSRCDTNTRKVNLEIDMYYKTNVSGAVWDDNKKRYIVTAIGSLPGKCMA